MPASQGKAQKAAKPDCCNLKVLAQFLTGLPHTHWSYTEGRSSAESNTHRRVGRYPLLRVTREFAVGGRTGHHGVL